MKTLKIGDTNFEASAVALGIMRMAGMDTAAAAKTLQTAVDSGINYIDSADIYGEGGSEKTFKEALKAPESRGINYLSNQRAGLSLTQAAAMMGWFLVPDMIFQNSI